MLFLFFYIFLVLENLALCSNDYHYFSRDEDCPPCFNCLDKGRTCSNFGICKPDVGLCSCPVGFGGLSCTTPLCGSLVRKIGTRPPRLGAHCICDSGWSGPNCNVCSLSSDCSALFPSAANTTCYKDEFTPVITSFMKCNVTNNKIPSLIGSLGNPTVSVTCDKATNTCNFQFWISDEESFACNLSECLFGNTGGTTICSKATCSCIPESSICGKNGNGVDITDLLKYLVKGPAYIFCKISDLGPKSSTGLFCTFKEEGISEILKSAIGDEYFELDCDSGECIDSAIIPNYKPPIFNEFNSWLFYGFFIPPTIFIFIFTGFFIYICFNALFRTRMGPNYSSLTPGERAETVPLLNGTIVDGNNRTFSRDPTTLAFKDIFYTLPNINGGNLSSLRACVLTSVHGIASPGKVLAIMGASGAGKSSLLDILAARYKYGDVSGEILVNGHKLSRSRMKKIIGYVDQEDILIPTLSVQEAIMYSALLRLPKNMSLDAKYNRVRETMIELDIFHIAHRKIGGMQKRGISGGEKRRVSIACEMVTSPAILLLDEPTSGLDATNALNVVESIVRLARVYGQTIAFTIHQPRSNIFALFDDLLLLGNGSVLYCGEANNAAIYFASLGYQCPPGFNIADYIMDLSLKNQNVDNIDTSQNLEEENEENSTILTINSACLDPLEKINQTENNRDKKSLESKYISSEAYSTLMTRISNASVPLHNVSTTEGYIAIRGSHHLNFLNQLPILSERTFKNTIRNPSLILAHYLIAIIVAIICSAMFYSIPNTIAGFQNRIGAFFFTCTLFSFSSLALMSEFSFERAIYIRERANRYYNPLTYFISKIIFDIMPMCIGPPIFFGSILYFFAGLRQGLQAYFNAITIMVTFNLAVALICFLIALGIRNTSLASLFSSLYMLFSILFSGLLLNKTSLPQSLYFTKKMSFFSLAIEALCANEMRDLIIYEIRYGATIKVPAAILLSTMGLDPTAFWPNLFYLIKILIILIILSFLALKLFVHERR